MKISSMTRRLRFDFMKVSASTFEGTSGRGQSTQFSSNSVLEKSARVTPGKCTTGLIGLTTQYCADGKMCSLGPITNRASLLPASTLCRQLQILSRQYSSIPVATADVGGIVQVELAQTGEGIADCELLRWFVQEGEEVDEFQPLCEVQSDKASVEITSRYKGKVSQVKFLPGDIVKVGETLLELIISGENHVSAATASNPVNQEPPTDSSLNEVSTSGHMHKNIQTTPAVRHLAKTFGIDLNDVPGSGKEGRILKDDILTFASAKMSMEEMQLKTDSDRELPSETDSESDREDDIHDIVDQRVALNVEPVVKDLAGRDKIIPVRGFRRIMAKTMTAAVAVPHFYYTEDVNVDVLVHLKDSLKHETLEHEIKLTYLPFLIKALSMALLKFPLMNSLVNEDVSEITVRESHNIGVGIATSSGLVVPNIKNVQQLSVLEIAQHLARLSELAASNRLTNEDVIGGTITVSNFGSIGGKYGSPVLNVPEVAIVAIGKIQKLPRYDNDGNVYPANIMGVTWGADHRVVDGATVANFCNQWKTIIEKPHHFLLNMR